MTQRQLAEALHSATEFVLNLVDQVGRRSGIDRLGQEAVSPSYADGESLDEGELGAEATQPLSFIRMKEAELMEADTASPVPLLDFSDEEDDGELISLDNDDFLDFDDEFVEKTGSAQLEFVGEEDPTLPLSLRPTMDEIGRNMAREVIINASGGSADDDPIERDPFASSAPIRPDFND